MIQQVREQILQFFGCVGEAVVAKGLRGLAEQVPFGPYLYDIADDAFARLRDRQQKADLRKQIEATAQAAFEEIKEVAIEVAERVAADHSPVERQSLAIYLMQLPATIRHTLRRPDDPNGSTVPASYKLERPEDLVPLLPERLPHYQPGVKPPELNGWVLESLLGRGGMGDVWLARHPMYGGLKAAVKYGHELTARDRALLHEGNLIARVQAELGDHPGIVPLRDAWTRNDEMPWLKYDYVDGGDLTGLIQQWQTLPPADRVARALAALTELADTVAHCHRIGIIHRDLKPANVLYDRNTRRLRISDFGIGGVAARRQLEAESLKSMSRGILLVSYLRGSHTPLYASPQQKNGDDPDPRDDVHALGVIGYQMFTGRLNQGAGSDLADDLREAGAPEGVIELLRRCTAQSVDRRPRDSAELLTRLRALGGQVPETVTAETVKTGGDGGEKTTGKPPTVEVPEGVQLVPQPAAQPHRVSSTLGEGLPLPPKPIAFDGGKSIQSRAGIMTADQLRAALEEAFDKTQTQKSFYGSVIDHNSKQNWESLGVTWNGQAIGVLCEFLNEHNWNMLWKAVTFLGYAVSTPEGKPHASNVVATVCAAQLWNDGCVQDAALKLIREVSIPRNDKWQFLLQVLDQVEDDILEPFVKELSELVPASGRELTQQLVMQRMGSVGYLTASKLVKPLIAMTPPQRLESVLGFLLEMLKTSGHDKGVLMNSLAAALPSSKRREFGRTLADMLVRTDVNLPMDEILKTLVSWNQCEHIPRLREALDVHIDSVWTTARVAEVLSQWKDRESIPLLRKAVERAVRNPESCPAGNYYHWLGRLMTALFGLEGSNCDQFVASVLRDAPPLAQGAIMTSDSARLFGRESLGIVKYLATSSSDPKVKAAAEDIMKRRPEPWQASEG